MKKIVFILLSFVFIFSQEILLDRLVIKDYLLEIRQLKETQNCYLYIFKKKNKDYFFYRTFDLGEKNAYFTGTYKNHRERKGFRPYFCNLEKAYKNVSINDRYKKLNKDVLGTLIIY